MRGGGDPSFLRKINSAAVLKALHAESLQDTSDGLTVSQLAAAIGVSRPTAEDASEALHAAGWIEVMSPDPNAVRSAGRPARRFRFRPEAGYVVGIDVEAAYVSAAVADLTGSVVGRDRRSAPAALSAEQRLETIRESIDAVLAFGRVPRTSVLGGAAGTTGIVDPDGRVVRNSLPGWTGLPLAQKLSEMLGAPATAYNHLRLSALGERWRGAAQDADDVMHLHAGQRMGVGMVVDGRLVIGAHGAAGEFSPSVAAGWVSAYSVLLRHPLGEFYVASKVGLSSDIGDASQIFDAASRGDQEATTAVETFARALVSVSGAIIGSFDPAVVVIGGDLARAGDVAIDPVQSALNEVCAMPPEVRVSQLGDDSITLGAIRSALDDVERRIFDDPQQLRLDPI